MIRSTHEMGFARSIADGFEPMDEGQVAEAKRPDVFFSNPRSERKRLLLSQILTH